MNIILMGPPGSGKSTLSNQLCDLGYVSLSPGALYKREAELGTEFGIHARDKYWGNGNLCPNSMTNSLVKQYVSKYHDKDIIFDGYPRTLIQAEYIDVLVGPPLVIDINASEDIITQRMLKRKSIENRVDDTEEIIKQRIKTYNTNNASIVKYYSNKNYHMCDGSGSADDTFRIVLNILNESK